jgi:hypothetical protein
MRRRFMLPMVDLNRGTCRLTGGQRYLRMYKVRELDDMWRCDVPGRIAVTSRSSEILALHWLALALSPRLGPTRGCRLVEHFGGVKNILKPH